MRLVSFNEYLKEILKNATYQEDAELGCIVAIASSLKGCMTQGNNFEEARENLIDAIEVWIMAGLMEGEIMPEINGVQLAITHQFDHLNFAEAVNA